ncbi:MAG: VWA domain-containing protein [Anaerolineales bacterium]|nr:VWA domain-containing protein [Anaerolineales bacterium]
MTKRRLLISISITIGSILVSGCAASTRQQEDLPVTAVPPIVRSHPQPTPTPLPTRPPRVTPTPVLFDQQQYVAAPLRAGEVDDNERWQEYLQFRRSYRGPMVHDVDVSERYIITALDGNDRPILDAAITVWDGQYRLWEARTFATGQTLFFPRAFETSQAQDFTVTVNKEGIAYTFNLHRGQQETWVAKLEQFQRREQRVNLDVLFLLDSTGSMGDEIQALQSSMHSIARQIDHMRPRPDLHFGLVWYRDRGDRFVVRSADFTHDVRDFSRQLDSVQAQGGGDYPESLNEALHEALHEMSWRDDDTIRLIFLIADAPPHLDYWQDYDYAQEMAVAAANGVKIFPIAASGADDQAEYIFRQLAQFTQGRYLFLTYEGPTNGGEPGDVSTMHVDGYGVQDLDDLVVRLVAEELAHQTDGQ